MNAIPPGRSSGPCPPNFDRIARLYRWGEYALLGPALERTRNHLLPLLAIRRNALVLGDGDGRFLARLLSQNPALRALADHLLAHLDYEEEQLNPTLRRIAG